jgi:6-phosphogluconolactonase
MAKTLITFPTPSVLAQSAANLVVQTMRRAIQTKGRCSIALSGGSTPRALYSLLAHPDYIRQIDWAKVTVFWGDERCVPADHPDSDYLMACQALLDHLPSGNTPVVHRMEGEIEPAKAANRYEKVLRAHFGAQPEDTFDLLLLGMGEDGHTASLFPDTQPIQETERWSVAHYVPKLSSWRLTLTPPILNRSLATVFLVSGKSKAETLKKVLQGSYNPDKFPSQVINPANGNLLWLVDADAGALLA